MELSCLGYMLGLFLAFIGFIFMNSSQPALFYICPLLLIVNIVTSLIRKEFKLIWSGDVVSRIPCFKFNYIKYFYEV